MSKVHKEDLGEWFTENPDCYCAECVKIRAKREEDHSCDPIPTKEKKPLGQDDDAYADVYCGHCDPNRFEPFEALDELKRLVSLEVRDFRSIGESFTALRAYITGREG